MTKTQVEQDLRGAIEAVQKPQKLGHIELPELVVELVADGDECAYQTTFAMKLAPLLKRHALEVAADIKSYLPDTYGDIDIVQHGSLKLRLSREQMKQAVLSIAEHGAEYGASSIGSGQRVLVECFSSIPATPLSLADARAAYTADVIARVYEELDYAVSRAALLHDREGEIERLGESVARRYLQFMGINVPYDDHLIDAEYVNELATQIELKDVTLTNLQKIEWLKRHIADQATDIMRKRMDKTLKGDMRIDVDEWSVDSRIVEQVMGDRMLQHLRDNDQVYQRGGSTYIRTAQFGDVRDRTILDRNDAPTDQYAELVLHYDRAIVREYDRIVLSLPWIRQDRAWFARQLPKLFGSSRTVATMVSGPMRMVADGEPITMRASNIADIFVHDVIDTYGAEIIRWFLIQHPTEHEVDFDVQTIKRQVGDELKGMKDQRKAMRSALRSADTIGTTAESFEHTFELPVERRLLHALLAYPELLVTLTRTHQPHQLVAFVRSLRSTVEQFVKQCPLVEDGEVVVYRYLLLQSAMRVISRILHITAIRIQKKTYENRD